MINQRYRLYAPKQFRVDLVDETLGADEIIVRTKYLAICEADKRYYNGDRPQEVLAKKLPMSLIHEAVGEVMYDPSGEFLCGQKVVMLPNEEMEEDEVIKGNYRRSSRFHSSGYDGFMQGHVKINKNRVLKYEKTADYVAVLTEPLSCIMNAIDHFEKCGHKRRNSFGIWGPGNMGFLTAIALKKLYPESKIYLFGIDHASMSLFPFVDGRYLVNEIPKDLMVDHAFECVGGPAAGTVINQIIDHINPQGCINLIGVSSEPVPINTRMVLEKGISLLGNSRADRNDFIKALSLIEDYEDVRKYIELIITEVIEVNKIADFNKAFDFSCSHPYKTIMKWNM